MKLDVLSWDKESNQMHLKVAGTSDAFLNLIRRFVIDEVPTLAVEDVEFKDNSSSLYDEIIAHRLGLTPIKTDLKNYTPQDECTCKGEGCAKCQLKLTLKANKKGAVTASEAESQDPSCTFVYGDTPIAKLTAKQKIELEATAILGRGKVHAKWCPGLVYFKREPSIDVSSVDLNDENTEKLSKVCGDIVSTDGKVNVNDNELYTSIRFDACVGALENAGATIEESDNHLLTVESWGQLECNEMLAEAAHIAIQRLEAVEKQL
jgi:DNA-directed RNA polymerase subunit D